MIKPRSRRGGGRPTISDVARKAGVGAITVSRALREPERVSQDLRRQIQAAVDELGYVPDPNARALASARAEVFGVLVPSLTNNVFAEVVRGIYDSLSDSAFRIQLGNTHYSGLEEERLLQVFGPQRPAALIVAGIDQTPASRKLLENAGCPVVQVMETGPDPVDMMVGFSHLDGGRAATEHLLEAGYRRIGFIGARMDPRSQRRLAGYRMAVEKAGLFDPRLITTTPVPSSVTLGRELFRDALAKMPTLDGVFCNNDDIALGALFECHRASIGVPKRIGIVGFNDLDMMQVAFPSVTSIRTPRYEIGRRAVAMALAAIGGEPPQQRVVDLGFELMRRESTAR
ncbi:MULTISPECIES: LacI family DNA-binding transcriptional regulator [unclassified Mesorhizobium]|uniref:LacI family DNA-binding transcriptional regulator n=1 Tax=unclassified Mesorhizobium TaxID=325217 RepID=UPI0011269C81|nr:MULTISPECIES: LacI family DNA-binding transcriptional regulator [unclassified Mesorhizobium]TPJ48969.1 LacI family DNA-binding transcriptional regulator [Mesorhizobium sp. B2-6-6]MBZ9702981.1 LacI family DNA-binding transcriptional regulator [Mesorhizobium sp. CO1-1-3]MBZ9897936.1 LacI family DNA-binding transcriptional regulator [Mesorhizobium sp. BR1-1-6]MBZ9920915.1 LacI family DNA-binding transcriptional regulator [Mesorhizobium sp. BR1-1-7]MBZ9949917.1 LacI family DNA-binding transcrip